ncbi:MAG: hypothetical protein DRP97_06375, partial [Candidatus Latescibacterota bacterium]
EYDEVKIFITADETEFEKVVKENEDSRQYDEVVLDITGDSKLFGAVLQKVDKDTRRVITEVKIDGDDDKARAKLKKLEKPTNSIHEFKPKTTSVDKAIARLSKTTHSTHIIREKIIKARASGGIIEKYATGGHTRKQGKISGHDLQGKDDVKALLTRGEFVQNVRAVDYYGADFMARLNARLIPKENLPRFATGGLVLNKQNASLLEMLRKNSLSSDKYTNDKYTKEDIKPTFSLDLSDLHNDFDSSEWNDFIRTMQEFLANPLPRGMRGVFQGLISKATKDMESLVKENLAITSNTQSLRNKTDGVELTESLFKQYSTKKAHIQSNKDSLKNKSESKLLEENGELSSVEGLLARKIAELDSLKSNIQSRSSELDIPVPAQVESSMDAYKLKKYDGKINRFVQQKALNKQKALQAQAKVHDNKGMNRHQYSAYAQIMQNFYGEGYVNGRFSQERYENFLNEQVALRRFKTGGMINGSMGGQLSGYGGGDKQLALLESGEGIIRKEAMQGIGKNWLDQVNSLKLPRFNTGGVVGDISKGSSNVTRNSVDINFKDQNGANMTTTTDEQTAKQLERYFKRFAQ